MSLPEPSTSIMSIPEKLTEIDDNNDGNIVNNDNKIAVETEQQLDQQVKIPLTTPSITIKSNKCTKTTTTHAYHIDQR